MNTFLFAAAEAVQTKTEIIAEGLVGMAVVLGILFALTIIIAVVSLFFKERPKAAAPKGTPVAVPVASAPVAAAAPVASGISDAHLKVVIAAAVHAVLSHRAASLQLAPGNSAWADEGRRSIFQSRKSK